MIINRNTIKTVYINLAEHIEKSESTARVLQQLGFLNFKRIDATRANPYYRGLNKSIYNSLEEFDGTPLAIFEDDIALTHLEKETIIVPDDADIVYLGGSINGYSGNPDSPNLPNGAELERVDGYTNAFKVHNMSTTHGMIFLNPLAVKDFKDYLILSYNSDSAIHSDVIMSDKIIKKYNVYLFGPIVYQDSDKNRVSYEKQTYSGLIKLLNNL